MHEVLAAAVVAAPAEAVAGGDGAGVRPDRVTRIRIGGHGVARNVQVDRETPAVVARPAAAPDRAVVETPAPADVEGVVALLEVGHQPLDERRDLQPYGQAQVVVPADRRHDPVRPRVAPVGTGPTTPVGTGRTAPAGTRPTTPVGTGPTTPVGTGPTTPVGTGRTARVGTGRTAPAGTGRTAPAGMRPTTRVGMRRTAPVGTGRTAPAGMRPTARVERRRAALVGTAATARPTVRLATGGSGPRRRIRVRRT